jgi:hypothetical protein
MAHSSSGTLADRQHAVAVAAAAAAARAQWRAAGTIRLDALAGCCSTGRVEAGSSYATLLMDECTTLMDWCALGEHSATTCPRAAAVWRLAHQIRRVAAMDRKERRPNQPSASDPHPSLELNNSHRPRALAPRVCCSSQLSTHPLCPPASFFIEPLQPQALRSCPATCNCS